MGVDPSTIDMVSFGVARASDPERWFFMHMSVLVAESSNGTVQSLSLVSKQGLTIWSWRALISAGRLLGGM